MIAVFVSADTTEVQRDLDEFARDADTAIEKTFEEIGKETLRFVRNDHSFCGFRLRNSIRWEKQGQNQLRVFTNVKHASYIDSGTYPHFMPAGKLIQFKVGGEVLFRRSTGSNFRHPGIKATHFFDRATAQATADGTKALAGRLDRLTVNFNR